MKFTPEDLQKIETKKLANIIRKLNAGGTLTAREDRILAEAKLNNGQSGSGPVQTSAVANYAGNWEELAKNLGVTPRAIRDWRDPRKFPKLQGHLPEPRADHRHDVTAWLELMVKFGLKRADEELHPGDLPNDDQRSTRDWKNKREELLCEKLQREIDREDGKLIDAGELEIPLGATFMAFQNRYSQFPERAAGRVTGFDDTYEVENRMREVVDADLRDLNAAAFLDQSLGEIIAELPFDEETARLLELVTFAGQDRNALLSLIAIVAHQALASIGRRAIAKATDDPADSPAAAPSASVEPAPHAAEAPPRETRPAKAASPNASRPKPRKSTKRRKA